MQGQLVQNAALCACLGLSRARLRNASCVLLMHRAVMHFKERHFEAGREVHSILKTHCSKMGVRMIVQMVARFLVSIAARELRCACLQAGMRRTIFWAEDFGLVNFMNWLGCIRALLVQIDLAQVHLHEV